MSRRKPGGGGVLARAWLAGALATTACVVRPPADGATEVPDSEAKRTDWTLDVPGRGDARVAGDVATVRRGSACHLAADCPVSQEACAVFACTPQGCQLQPVAPRPCDDGNACTHEDACNQGSCVGKRLLFAAVHDDGHDDTPAAVVHGPQGGYLLAGARRLADGHDEFLAVAFDRYGAGRWTVAVPLGSDARAHAAVAVAGGGLVAVGEALSATQGWDAAAVRVDADGAVVWQVILGGADHDHAYAATLLGAEVWLAGSNRSVSGKAGSADAWVVQLGLDGKATSSFVVGAGDLDERARAITGLGDDVVVAGSRAVPGGGARDAWLGRASKTGTLLWQKALVDDAAEDGLIGVAAAGTGVVTCGHWGTFDGAAATWVIRLDGAGSVLWQTQIAKSSYGAATASGLSLGPDGIVHVVGWMGTKPGHWRLGVGNGNLLATTGLSFWPAARARAIVQVGTGIAVALSDPAPGGNRSRSGLVRALEHGGNACHLVTHTCQNPCVWSETASCSDPVDGTDRFPCGAGGSCSAGLCK